MMALRDLILPRLPVVAAATVAKIEGGQIQRPSSGNSALTREAWKIWRCVGEIHYATTQQARLISRLHWNISLNGNQLDDETAVQMLDAAFGSDTLPELTRLQALHLQVAGAYYFVRRAGAWEVLTSPPDHKQRTRLETSEIAIRVDNPDPEDPDLTDSPVLASLDVARELVLARAQARASARNRTAQLNTVLYPTQGVQDAAVFEQQLLEVMTAPLSDEFSPSVVVPNLIGFDGEWIEKWKTLDLSGPIDEKLHEKIDRLVRQLAVILDIPPEILLGMGDVSHWSAWAVQEDNWLGHVEPLAKIVGNGLALAIEQAGELPPDSVTVTPDPAPLLQRRPSIADALAAYSAGAVDAEFVRTSLGADEDDAPTAQTDPAVQLALEMVGRAPSLAKDPGIEILVSQIKRVLSGAPAPELPAEVSVEEIAVSEPVGAAVPTQLPFSTERLLAVDEAATLALTDMIDAAVLRVQERIGARVRSRLQGDPELREQLAGVSNADLPARFGTANIPGLDDLVAETLLSQLSTRWLRLLDRSFASIRAAGVDIAVTEDVQEASLGLLLQGAADIASDALAGEVTVASTWALVVRTLNVAGGGVDPLPPETAAPRRPRIPMPSPLDGVGLGTGKTAIDWVIANVGVVPTRFIWRHIGPESGDDHPQHLDFNGREYDGEAIEQDGVTWFIGDHAGCVCQRVPIWEEA